MAQHTQLRLKSYQGDVAEIESVLYHIYSVKCVALIGFRSIIKYSLSLKCIINNIYCHKTLKRRHVS